MEELFTWLAKEIIQHALLHWAWLLVVAVLAVGGYMLGALVFDRRYKQRIATLEGKVADQNQALEELRSRSPSSSVTINMPEAVDRSALPFVHRQDDLAWKTAPTPETWISRIEADAMIRQSSLVRIPVEAIPPPKGPVTLIDILVALGKRTTRGTKADELTRDLLSDFDAECPQGVKDDQYGKELLERWIAKRSAAKT